MNKKLKRGFAVVFTAALLCNSLGLTQLFPNGTNDISVTYAASEFTSGSTNRYFYTEDNDLGFKLFYSVIDSKAKTATVTGCTTYRENTAAYVPETVTYQNVKYTVVSIGNNAFRDQKNLFSASLPKSITSIESFAFAGCSNLYFVSASSYTGDGRYKLNKIGSDVNWGKFENLSCMYINTETGKWSIGVRYGGATVNPSAYNKKKNPSFCFELYYKPDSIVSNPYTPEGTLKGMDLVNKLLSIRK